jgi:hypothetical protein
MWRSIALGLMVLLVLSLAVLRMAGRDRPHAAAVQLTVSNHLPEALAIRSVRIDGVEQELPATTGLYTTEHIPPGGWWKGRFRIQGSQERPIHLRVTLLDSGRSVELTGVIVPQPPDTCFISPDLSRDPPTFGACFNDIDYDNP